jgi:hypothetical protein
MPGTTETSGSAHPSGQGSETYPGETFDALFLLARPAAGKSEIIDYLRKTPAAERRRRFHLGEFTVLDDFPMLWTWFEEDALLEEMGKPRLHTDAEGNFAYPYLWHLLIRRLCLEYRKLRRDSGPEERSAVIEFSRGASHGGYTEAFRHIDRDLLQRSAILYVDVSYEESQRKNRRRKNPERPDSILEHSLPDEKLAELYKEIDWKEFKGDDPAGYIELQGIPVPYVELPNEDDVTTNAGPPLGERLEEYLNRLWERCLG